MWSSVGCGVQQQVFEADNEFCVLMSASRYSEKSQSEKADTDR